VFRDGIAVRRRGQERRSIPAGGLQRPADALKMLGKADRRSVEHCWPADISGARADRSAYAAFGLALAQAARCGLGEWRAVRERLPVRFHPPVRQFESECRLAKQVVDLCCWRSRDREASFGFSWLVC